MNKLLFSFLILLFLPFHSVSAAIPNDEELFEQQLLIYELTKEKNIVSEDIKSIEKSIEDLEKHIQKEQKKFTDLKSISVEHMIDYYAGKELSWIEMLFSSDGFLNMLTQLFFIGEETHKSEKQLSDLYNTYHSLTENKLILQKEKEKNVFLKQSLEKNLKELKIAENHYKNSLGLQKNVEEAKQKAIQFLMFWENEGIPSFHNFFKQTVQAMNHADQLVNKENINRKRLLTYEVEIDEKDFNQFLSFQNSQFESTKFSFEHNKLVVSGKYNGLKLNVIGSYKIKHNIIDFSLESIEMNSIKLPEVTVKRLEKNYDLNIYPEKIYAGIKVKSIHLEDGKLIVLVSI